MVRERCGYSPPDPMLEAKEAAEEAKRWAELAQKAKGTTAVKRYENAIAMYYLADFIRHDEENATPGASTARYPAWVNVGIVHGHI